MLRVGFWVGIIRAQPEPSPSLILAGGNESGTQCFKGSSQRKNKQTLIEQKIEWSVYTLSCNFTCFQTC